MKAARALLVLAALVAGCTDAVTSIRVAVEMPPSTQVDGLAVLVDSERTVTAVASELTLLVPDAWAGSTMRLAVDGLRASEIIASGSIDVVPIAGAEVVARVQLVAAGCPTQCTVGEARCEADGVITCVMAQGCPVWSEPLACPSNAPYCSNGTCAATCSDECTTGAPVCDGTTGVRTCANTDSDPCLDWSTTACTTGEHCVSGACEPEPEPEPEPMCPTTCEIESVPSTAKVGAVTSDGTHIYFTTDTGIVRRNEATGAVQPFASSPARAQILNDATHVYWSEGDTIVRRAKTGGSTEVVALANEAIHGMTLDQTHVWWVERNSGTIRRRSKTLGSYEAFTAKYPGVIQIVADSTHVYWSVLGGDVTESHVYRSLRNGGSLQVLAMDMPAMGLAVDDTHLYMTGLELARVPKAGGSVETIDAYVEGFRVAVDATHVVWIDGNHQVRIRAKSGGPSRVLAQTPSGSMTMLTLSPTMIAWGSTNTYEYFFAPRCGCEP